MFALRREKGTARAISTTMSDLIVWFDGDCPLCRREIALMRSLDRRRAIDFIDLSSSTPEACPVDRTALLARFHASEGGRLLSGAAAFAAMWRAIPLLRPLGLAARSPLVLAGLEAAYRVFLRMRPSLQRLAAGGRRA
jgi:predicted DCC family thiol-disulfide oxidoreductase YuxK